MKWDFVVIDSYHFHPVEILNFIAILPWLHEGTIVILHDISAFEIKLDYTFGRMLSPRLLLSSVCAEKLIPDLPSWEGSISNIAALRINKDTYKYCQNLFDILYFPWETSVSASVSDKIGNLVERHYPSRLYQYYLDALSINRNDLFVKKVGIKNIRKFSKLLADGGIIFYGAGNCMKEFLEELDLLNIKFNCTICDQAYEKIKTIHRSEVISPNFITTADKRLPIVVMIEDEGIFTALKEQFQKLGFIVFHGLEEASQSL